MSDPVAPDAADKETPSTPKPTSTLTQAMSPSPSRSAGPPGLGSLASPGTPGRSAPALGPPGISLSRPTTTTATTTTTGPTSTTNPTNNPPTTPTKPRSLKKPTSKKGGPPSSTLDDPTDSPRDPTKQGKGKDLSHVPCRFYKMGMCAAGDGCVFSHGAVDSESGVGVVAVVGGREGERRGNAHCSFVLVFSCSIFVIAATLRTPTWNVIVISYRPRKPPSPNHRSILIHAHHRLPPISRPLHRLIDHPPTRSPQPYQP